MSTCACKVGRYAVVLVCTLLWQGAPLQTSAGSVWDSAVTESLQQAEALLAARGVVDRSTRLLLPILTGWGEGKVCCLLKDLEERLFPLTPSDVFVFSEGNIAQQQTGHCTTNGSQGSNVFFLPLRELYVTPLAAGTPDTWTAPFPENYRRMGHWRLTFQFSFAHQLGYEYLWQLDDDSHLVGMVPYNLVQFATEKRLQIGAHEVATDSKEIMWGLAELTRYHIVAEHLQPETLFDHCSPPSLEGLFTVLQLNSTHSEQFGGWDRAVLYGNCMLINIPFWMEERVQKYVHFVVQTGAHFRFRWNEQGVMAMVWQLFVPQDRFVQLLAIDYLHPRHCPLKSVLAD